MRLIFKYLVNNLKMKKFRTALIVVFLVLCNFLIIANLGINDYYTKAYNANVEYEKGNIDLMITSNASNGGGENLESFLFEEGEVKLPEKSVESYFEALTALGKTKTDSRNIKVTIIGVDLNSAINEEMVHGVDLRDDNHEYIVISESASELLGKGIGDKLTIELLGEEYHLTITNIAKEGGIFANDNDNSITMIMKLSWLQTYYHLDDAVSSVNVNVTDSYNLDKVIQDIREMNMEDGETTVSIAKSFDEEAFSQKKSANSLALMVAMLIMIFISVYLISFISKVILLERMQVMGTFQSIGATPFKTILIFIGENVCYGILGWIGGSGLSFVMCPKVFGMLNSFQTNRIIDTTINPLYYIVAFAASVVIMLFCSLGSVICMRKKTVKELLISNIKEENGMHIFNILFGIIIALGAYFLYKKNTNYNLLLGVACFILTVICSIVLCKVFTWSLTKLYDLTLGRIFRKSFHFGVDNLRRDKMLSSSVTLITIVISMLLCIVMVIQSVKGSMETMIDNNDFDISCTNLSSELSDYDLVNDIDGVEQTFFDYIYNTKAEVTDVKLGATLVGVDNEDEFYSFRSESIVYDRNSAEKLLDGRNVMVDSFWADKNSVTIGDKISFTDLETNEVIGEEFEVIDFIDSSGFTTARDTIMIDVKYIIDELDAEPYQFLIKVNSEYTVEEVSEEVADMLVETPTVVMTITEVVNNSMSGVDSLIMILYLIIGISALLVIFGVINNITVSFLTRKRELAVLYSTSMSKGQLSMMFYGEIIIMYIVTILYSTGFTVLYKYIMPKILWSVGLAFQIYFPMEGVIATAVVLFVLLNLLVIIPVINLYRMNTVEVLKCD